LDITAVKAPAGAELITPAVLHARRREGWEHGAVAAWLFACCALIFLMVVIGGITRLTLSGLSITEWQPVVGVVPPLSTADWAAEFAKYQQTPEYRLIHYGMTLDEFKNIYWWEYAHRLLGRLIALAYAIPFAWFLVRGRLPRRLVPPLCGILLLGFAQGGLGWYMVESGLADRVEVSQYRLVAHLALALAIYAAILWVALGIVRGSAVPARRSPVCRETQHEPPMAGLDPAIHVSAPADKGVGSRAEPGHGAVLACESVHVTVRAAEDTPPAWRRAADAVLIFVSLTIVAGGFVAGTRAGLTYNTFPLMDGRLIPEGYAQLRPFISNWFENIAAVQFDHRLLAVATAIVISLVWAAGWRSVLPRPVRTALHGLLAVGLLQVALGIATLVLVVPIPLAAAHQAGAVLLLTAAINFRHTMCKVAAMDENARAPI
jgi:cytochrome c oxidase assembly protein subunit 15